MRKLRTWVLRDGLKDFDQKAKNGYLILYLACLCSLRHLSGHLSDAALCIISQHSYLLYLLFYNWLSVRKNIIVLTSLCSVFQGSKEIRDRVTQPKVLCCTGNVVHL